MVVQHLSTDYFEHFLTEVPLFLFRYFLFRQPKIVCNMKIIFTLLLLIGVTAVSAQNAIDGNWKGTRETPNGSLEINYTFKVAGNELTGTWKTEFGEAKLEKGKVDGKKF